MKKAIILSVLGLGIFMMAKKKEAPGTTSANNADGIFNTFQDQVIVDSEGYWMLVKDGKIYTVDQNTLTAWQIANGNKPSQIMVNFPVWTYWVNKNISVFSGAYRS